MNNAENNQEEISARKTLLKALHRLHVSLEVASVVMTAANTEERAIEVMIMLSDLLQTLTLDEYWNKLSTIEDLLLINAMEQTSR